MTGYTAVAGHFSRIDGMGFPMKTQSSVVFVRLHP
jgi:hypothetical protein